MSTALDSEIPVKILLVDDKQSNLVALESVLCGGDYTVVSVTSGAAALACLEKHDDFAVILTDVMMPIMDGFEFATRVKQNEAWRDIPIIFLTAMASDVVSIFRGYEIGAVDFLQKPLEPDFVRAKVAIFVQLFRQKRIIKRQSEDLLAIERRRIKAHLQTIANKKRLEELQDIQLKVTRIFADSAPVFDATRLMLEAIAKGLGWQWAALWMIDSTRTVLRPTSFWHEGSQEFKEFEAVCKGIDYPYGSGLIGKAWEAGEPRWVKDLATDLLMPRFTSALQAGLNTGVVAPIWVGDEIAGVVEFYTCEVALEEEQVLAMMSDLGSRVGVYIMRKRTETDLQESNERFRLLVEGVKDHAIFMLDREGNVATWNLGAQRIVGYEADEIVGKHYSCFFTEDARETHVPQRNLSLAAREGFFEEDDLHLRKDGTVFWANSQITPIYDDLGVLKGFSKITRDITERRLAEDRLIKVNEELEHRIEQRTQDLKRQEAQLRAVADALPVLVAELDRDQKFIFANEACKKWVAESYSGKEILGRCLRDVLDVESYVAIAPFIKDVLSGRRATFERGVGKVADKKVFNIALIPEFDETREEVNRFILVASDISQYKQIEEALRRSKALADTASAAKGAFLANMSHEIRTPLGAVLGFAELIANPQISMADRGNYLAAMRRNGDLLSNIINDILDLSKVEAGKFDIELVETALSDVLPDVTSLLSLQAAEKGIRLSISSEGPIPRTIRTDPLRLRQILLNIVGNAVKFTVSGSVDVKVKQVMADNYAPRLAFEVSDTGPGISAEIAAKLFEPFTQADPSTKRKFGGTGLGLVLSRKLARLLGGDVVLADPKTIGCTFVVTIDPGPIQAMSIDGIVEKRAPGAGAAANRLDLSLEGAEVLLVEDALDNRLLVSRFLTIAGAKVDTAENGKEALEKFGEKTYSAVLMDLQMPTMDGYEAMAELKRQGTKIPVIALTAHAMKEDRLRCLAAGFNDHISKPINRQELIELLSRHIEGHVQVAH